MKQSLWNYIFVASGWNIRDADGVLLAIVPDSAHEHEADARRIVEALAAHAALRQESEPAPSVPVEVG
ncbi:MAG: hypothetical protein IPJ77_07295 [Planctomycetes bacterium]|nr:hypothetical protein [Planctomycetota bacterium]